MGICSFKCTAMAAVGRNVCRFGGIFVCRAQNTILIRTSRSFAVLTSVNRNKALEDQPRQSTSTLLVPHRTFLPGLPNPFSKGNGSSKKLEYSERRVLGYTMDQMYEVVAEVEKYHEFVPWVTQSVVDQHRRRPRHFKCKLTVGFPPVVERYTSIVTTSRPHLVKADCSDGKIFNSLTNLWKFYPGIEGNPKTCTIVFSVQFEFRNQLHSHIARMFFDEVVRTMVNAFLKRAEELYGPQSIAPRKKKILAYTT